MALNDATHFGGLTVAFGEQRKCVALCQRFAASARRRIGVMRRSSSATIANIHTVSRWHISRHKVHAGLLQPKQEVGIAAGAINLGNELYWAAEPIIGPPPPPTATVRLRG